MISGDIGFDNVIEKPIVLPNSISVSVSGNHIVSSSLYGDTYLEHVDNDGVPPVRLLPGSADTIGFFGRNVDLVAIAFGSTLKIIRLYKIGVIATLQIKPGSLFVPPSGKSSVIGMVSPNGQTYVLDDELNLRKESLNIGKEYKILWSSNVKPVGYMWQDEDYAHLYIRSKKNTNGATFTSAYGFTMHGVWANPVLERHEAFIVDQKERHILKRIVSNEDNEIEIENVKEFPEGSVITDVVLLPNGQPNVVSAIHNAENISESLSPDNSVSNLMKDVTSNNIRNTSAQYAGNSSFISWSQTPVTSPVASVTNYGLKGIPRYEVKGIKTLKKNPVPECNMVKKMYLPDKQVVKYRFISPYNPDYHLLDTAVIIVDDQGFCSAGAYSPTVRMFYEMGIAVAIVPVRKYSDKAESEYFLDLVDVSLNITGHGTKKEMGKRLAKNVFLLSSGRLNKDAIKALQHRKSEIEKLIMIDPTEEEISMVKKKFIPDVSVVNIVDEVVEVEPLVDNKLYTVEVSKDSQDLVSIMTDILL